MKAKCARLAHYTFFLPYTIPRTSLFCLSHPLPHSTPVTLATVPALHTPGALLSSFQPHVYMVYLPPPSGLSSNAAILFKATLSKTPFLQCKLPPSPLIPHIKPSPHSLICSLSVSTTTKQDP